MCVCVCVCVCDACVYCVFVCTCMYVCLFVCLFVYECYVCVILDVSALSVGVGGVWRIEAGSYKCVCVACVYCVFVCTCMYVCLFVCLCVYEWYVCVTSVVSALSAGVGGVLRIEAGSYECVCVACVYCVFVCTCMYVCLFVCLCVYEWYVCVTSVVSALSADVGGVLRIEAGSYECVCVACVYCVFVCTCMYVCLFVCLCVYEWYVCVTSVVSALSAGVGGVLRIEAGSYECVCVACVYFVFMCTCMYVCLFVCLFVYECYVCVILVASALSVGVGGVWRIEAGSYECVCVACV